jgi:N-methylhydantoinase A
MNDVFAELERQARAEAEEEGFTVDAVRLTRLLDLRYLHQGYTLPVTCPAQVVDGDAAKLKAAFDELHHQVYGQSAPKEDAEIVTFRIQAEIEVPRLVLPEIEAAKSSPESALKGTRPLFDIEAGRFVDARIYDRAKLLAGHRIEGPAIIDQFDSTTVMLSDQFATVDRTGTLIIQRSEAS